MATIAFLGIGTMGAGMVKNLAKHQHRVLAYNRTRERAEQAAGEDPLITAADLEKTAGAELIITCLADDAALDETLFGSGLIRKLSEGQTLIDCGTTSLEMTRRIAEACAARGVGFLDAPVTGSRAGAEGGTLLFMVGGEGELFERCLPLLQAMGTRHVHCGPATYGQRAKIALNLTQAMILESYLEGLALGIKNGVPIDAMVEILDNSGAKNGIASAKLPAIRKGDFQQRFKLGLMHKDLRLAESEMTRLGLELPLASMIAGVYHDSMAYAEEDISATAKRLERQGIVFRPHD